MRNSLILISVTLLMGASAFANEEAKSMVDSSQIQTQLNECIEFNNMAAQKELAGTEQLQSEESKQVVAQACAQIVMEKVVAEGLEAIRPTMAEALRSN